MQCAKLCTNMESLNHNHTHSKLKKGSLVVLSGPSGSGKSTLLQRLFSEFKDRFAFSVSCTTRQPRPGEVPGKDYYFLSRSEMEKAISNEEFIEHAEFAGNLYGTSKKAVKEIVESGKICILDVEVQGVQNVKRTNMPALYIFIQPPDLATLEDRLRKRGTETEAGIKSRLETAQAALAYANPVTDDGNYGSFDSMSLALAAQPGSYDVIIENNELEKAYSEFKAAITKDLNDVRKRSSEINPGQ